MGHGMWGGCCSGLFGGFGGLGLVGPILNLVITAGLIIGVVVLIIWAIRRLSSSQNTVLNRLNQQGIAQAPLEILKSRYAGGEITREEFIDMKKDLK
jgi:putative membrane protein